VNNRSADSVVRRAYLLVGRATRLPGKFWLPIGGKPIVIRAVEGVRSAGLTVAVVSSVPIDIPGVAVESDAYDAGPLGGLETVLQTTSEPFFLFGADMPFLDGLAIRRMVREYDGRTLVPRNR
jgi:molybdopterin-guanine dinucleotide biosynthesis protein A